MEGGVGGAWKRGVRYGLKGRMHAWLSGQKRARTCMHEECGKGSMHVVAQGVDRQGQEAGGDESSARTLPLDE